MRAGGMYRWSRERIPRGVLRIRTVRTTRGLATEMLAQTQNFLNVPEPEHFTDRRVIHRLSSAWAAAFRSRGTS